MSVLVSALELVSLPHAAMLMDMAATANIVAADLIVRFIFDPYPKCYRSHLR